MTAKRQRAWLVAGIAVFGALALAAGIVIGTHVPRRGPDESLAADFARLQSSLHATAGIAISAVFLYLALLLAKSNIPTC